MATLEKIRNKAGIIVAAVIGLALLGFILQDFFDSRKSFFGSNPTDVGEISGDKIPYQLLEKTKAELTENYKLLSQQPVDEKMQEQIQEQAWQQIVHKKIMVTEYDKLGLTVGPDELWDLVQGNNPHQIIRQMFTSQTGEFLKADLQNFLKQTNSGQNITDERLINARKVRLYIEEEITNQRLNSKYNTLIAKGLSVPKFMAKNDFIENNRKADFSYIMQRYSSVSDSAIKVTSSDLKDYYDEHKYLYDQTASRDIEYVSFDVVPSATDRSAALDEITKTKPDFAAATAIDVESFVKQYNTYIDKNYKQSELPDSVSAYMFSAAEGDVYGPYLENEAYKLARLYKIVYLPDSVKARHILLTPKGQTQEDVDLVKKTADSIKGLVDKGADFAELAKKYSEDKSNSEKGGDLGWFKEDAMVKPFNDAAFEAKKKEVKVVLSQFGYHVVQVLDKSKDEKKVKVAFVEIKITPSQRTYDLFFAQANKFASDNRTYEQFKAAVVKQNLIKKLAANITENDKDIQGLTQARQIVKWAYNAKKSEVSEPISLGTDHYIVAAVTEVREKGFATLEQVKSEVDLQVRKKKKAEKITADVNKAKAGVTTIQDLALKLNSPLEVATGISFSSYIMGNAGNEPKVISVAVNSPKDKITPPVDGNNGVYVLFVTNIVNPPAEKDYDESKRRLNSNFSSRATYEAYSALRKAAEIEDKRSRYY